MGSRIFLRTWLGCLIWCLPLLALLLIPQLMRSRAGNEQMLFVGVGLLLALVIGCFAPAPMMSAWLTGVPGSWDIRSAWAATREVWRQCTAQASFALVAAIAIYAAGQALGYGLAEVVPYVHDNPAHVTDPTASPWIIDYPAYALQALVIYAATTLAVAVYAWRIRTLRLRSAQAVNHAATSPTPTTT
ncbi:MAG TPA: hypothetical protein VFF85_02890 [Microbacterium sp.]|nr:hypothetical protein [Microbacterium sp.]